MKLDQKRTERRRATSRLRASGRVSRLNREAINNDVLQYLNEALQSKAKFYVKKRGHGWGIVSIHFDHSKLHGDAVDRLVKYFLDTQEKGHEIFVLRPREELRRVYFLEKRVLGREFLKASRDA